METPIMRAKFAIQSITCYPGGNKVLKMSAVAKNGAYPADGSDEDNTYAKFTPSASLEITVTNPVLHGQFIAGTKYYVDFTPAGL